MAGLLSFFQPDFNTLPGVSNAPIEKTGKRLLQAERLQVAQTAIVRSRTNIVSPGLKSDILRGNSPSRRTATSRIIAYLCAF